MGDIPDNFTKTRKDAVEYIHQEKEQEWEELAEETAFTMRQISIWELAVKYDIKQVYVARKFDVRESTVSRHVERFREKADQVDTKIEELEAELQRWKETKRYLESLDSY